MKTFDEMNYHPTSEQLVQILCDKTQNSNPLFFRVLVGYYFSMVASMMRCSIATHDRGNIPVNLYALNLSTSGSGKGMSNNIIRTQVTHLFRQRFTENTFPLMAEMNLPKLAVKRANKKGTDPDEEIERVKKEFDACGPLLYSFSEGTPPAVKQIRHKLLMAEGGSLNLQIDEIGSNLLANADLLVPFLEMYDMGYIDPKLIKNTQGNIRSEEIIGPTPANMMLFGTPSKLLNGSKTEDELYSMLDTGYARRFFFGYSKHSNNTHKLTPEELYDRLTDQSSNQYLETLSDQLGDLADISNVNRKLSITKATSLILIEYRMKCEKIASEYSEHDEMRKNEMSHRYFKALKLAGAYAFIDNSMELTEEHLYQAIKLAEESGEAFHRLLTRERNYVKLAKYIADVKTDITQADMVEDLPFYRGHAGQKQEMLALATVWGYKNNIIIKKSYIDGMEFLRGESLVPTNLDELIVSWSRDYIGATGYKNELAPWSKMHIMTTAKDLHWVNHHLQTPDRNEENCKLGFNLLVLDIDGTVNINTAKMLLKNQMFLTSTTKSHTDEESHFRMILPMNYTLKLDKDDFKEFMGNVYDWLPFPIDRATRQRARKWLTYPGQYEYNDGVMFDVLPFIPKTSKNEERKVTLNTQQSMDNMERWFVNHIGDGNRNNMLLRYATVLVDAGKSLGEVSEAVLALNDKIPDKLDFTEIQQTILVTAAKKIHQR